MADSKTQGWAPIYLVTGGWSKKDHWFGPDGRSLCGRYLRYGHPQDGYGAGPGRAGDCAACKKKLAKQTQQAEHGKE